MLCSLLKPIRKEFDAVKTRHDEQIHEYNYSCYKCLNPLFPLLEKVEQKIHF